MISIVLGSKRDGRNFGPYAGIKWAPRTTESKGITPRLRMPSVVTSGVTSQSPVSSSGLCP